MVTPMVGSDGKRVCLVETTHEGQMIMDGHQLRLAATSLRWRGDAISASVACIFEISAHGLDGGFIPCV